jgi:phage protein D
VTFDRESPGFSIKLIAHSPVSGSAGSHSLRSQGPLVESDLTDRVLALRYEDSEKERDVLKLTVDNHDLKFFDDQGLVKGNLIKVVFGYPGRLFGPRVLVIDELSGFDELTVVAVDESALLNKARNRLFKNMTRSQVVREVVKGISFLEVSKIVIDETGISDEKATDWQQAKQSDWQFLLELAEKVSYEVYVEGDVFRFAPRKLAGAPVRKYEWYWGDGNLKDFSLTEFRTTDKPAEVEVKAYDPIERQEVVSIGSDGETKRDVLGAEGTSALTRGAAGELVRGTKVVASPERDGATVKHEADMHFKRHEEQEIKAKAEIIGDSYLPAKSVIEITGISDLLSGKYYVEKHTHELSRDGGYSGKLVLIKNAVDRMPTSEPPELDSTKATKNVKGVKKDQRQTYVRDSTGKLIQEGASGR